MDDSKENYSSNDEDSDSGIDYSESFISDINDTKKKIKKPKKVKLIVNVLNTEYEVVKETMKRTFGYKLSVEADGEWDLFWANTGVTNEMLCKMKKYQKINHYPSMCCITRKNNLGRNLIRIKQEYPNEYNFFPETWLLPYDWKEFRNQFAEKKNKTFIIKPEAS